MEDPIDVSYYLGKQEAESLSILDIPLNSGQIVSINLDDELPEDSKELINFLRAESCPLKYWIAVAIAYAQRGIFDGSKEVVENALAISQFSNEDKVKIRVVLVWVYLKYASQGIEKDNSLNLAQQGINELSNAGGVSGDISYLLSKAVLHLYRDDIEQSLDTFDAVLKANYNNCFAILGKAHIILNQTKNYANALKLYQQVLILNPLMKPDPRIGIGLCFWFLKDEKMAIKSWQRALEIDPQNVKAKILLNLAEFNTAFNYSLNDEDFRSNYQACLNQVVTIYNEAPNDISVLLTLASYYFSKKNYDVVQKLCEKVIGEVSESAKSGKASSSSKLSRFQSNVLSQTALWLGRVFFAKSDFIQAQRYFHEAIKLNENNLLAKLGLGHSQINRGSTEEATITFESILKTNPKCSEVNYCLGMLYAKHKSRRKQELGIQILERYIRLCNNRGLSDNKNEEDNFELLNKEPVILNAYLTLSRLYESRDINQSLNYLKKAIESRRQIKQDVPLEIYNNIGVFQFLKSNYSESAENFQKSYEKLEAAQSFTDETGDVLMDLKSDLKVSLSFNLARSKEISDQSDAIEIYNGLLKECPHYFSAKLRLLFLNCLINDSAKDKIKEEVEEMLSVSASDLEIRSFYGWFSKNFGKKLGMKPDDDTKHQKDTLVEYDSHDCYALLSLANIYCIMARDIKGSSQDEKKKKYYIRAIELFSKVLSVDPKNVFGAQGLAIVYIENKELNKGLELLRKIRDSLNDISVYLNLGHVMLELKQFAKSIEHYEIALMRYSNGNDPNILSFLGRAWYMRGMSEKNLSFMNTALSYCERALSLTTGLKSSFKFNIAYVQFQIAELVTKLPVEQRKVEDIKEAITNLQKAIESLNQLASDEEKHPPYPKSDLKSRASLGTNTLLNRLNTCLEATIKNVQQSEQRMEEAKRLREEERARIQREQEETRAKQREKEEELAKERAALQEQAKQWAEEARMNVVESEDDDRLFDEESAANEKKSKKASQGSKSKKGKGKKKRVVAESDSEQSSKSDEEVDVASPKKRSREDDDESKDGQDETADKKRKANALSNEIIDDSDEGLENTLSDGDNKDDG
ncbi:Piso0_000789 [Millerozyma farinosa CBS 7064]|uniref:Piso0_000789 protein n=1 Tax=Pichia sorbitophila (strain ATCC MYA-4447 / BCRC 22081 / CBS 7064 / NBRC 10061 / NRRL Y-12695) TaxID=559304 RepID=G8YRI6_PICSO|nr:Piso0_000789 [Millerozyma farinosa CBS 7064]